MRILTITCHNVNNFGATLQAMALAEYLRHQGHDAHIIDYVPVRESKDTPKSRLRRFMELPPLRPLTCLIERYRSWRSRERRIRFDSFLSEMPLTRRYYTLEELRQNPPVADLYICGSDQIWNPRFPNGNDPAFYLGFGPDITRRASYAASFASRQLPEGCDKAMKTWLSGFDHISVRESSGLEILSSLGYNGLQVVDPVFLLPRPYWERIADHSEIKYHDKYLLIYAFDQGILLRDSALRLAKEHRLKIVSVSPFPIKGADIDCRNAGPAEFLGLLREASMVLTESFHALAFAMIFEVPFYAFLRQEDLNARLTDFLDTLGLSDRLITSEPDSLSLSMPDVTDARKILNNLRDTSVDYLDNITS